MIPREDLKDFVKHTDFDLVKTRIKNANNTNAFLKFIESGDKDGVEYAVKTKRPSKKQLIYNQKQFDAVRGTKDNG